MVTGPLGIIETYKFSTLQGVPKVTEIDRASNGTVAFASRGFTYDTNGYLKTETDWNGNQTGYTNNSHGLPTRSSMPPATRSATRPASPMTRPGRGSRTSSRRPA